MPRLRIFEGWARNRRQSYPRLLHSRRNVARCRRRAVSRWKNWQRASHYSANLAFVSGRGRPRRTGPRANAAQVRAIARPGQGAGPRRDFPHSQDPILTSPFLDSRPMYLPRHTTAALIGLYNSSSAIQATFHPSTTGRGGNKTRGSASNVGTLHDPILPE